MRITMDADGRLTIPREIREEAGLSAGAPLEIRVRDGKIEIEAADRGGAVVPGERGAGTTSGRSLSLVRGKGQAAAGVARVRPERPELDLLIRMAIAHRRQVELVYSDRLRVVEPHDYGMRNGEPQLLVHQRAGDSRSGQPAGWRSLKVSAITDFRVLEETFPGRRPADRPIDWDVLYARVEE